MPYRELDTDLTEEQGAARDMARRFGSEVMRPVGIELDDLHDPADVIAEGSPLWKVFRQHRELGLHKQAIPKAVGGMLEDVDLMSAILISEEMGYADAGLAISLGVASMPFAACAMSPEPELQGWARAFCEDTEANLIGCWGIIEPDHGSDWVLSNTEAGEDTSIVPSVRAVKKGDEYIINGQKAAWVSNGTLATHCSLHVSVDPSRGMRGTGLAIVPLDLPGISRGKPLNKIGQRALNQGEIFFEDVRIPQGYMLVPDPDVMTAGSEASLARVNGGMGIIFAGLARAAFDEAYRYSKERIQSGRPIFEHQNIKLKLFRMYKMVESARSLARRTTLYNYHPATPSLTAPPAVASKVLSTETAFEVASEAIQIFGGNGLSKEYCIEKIFRDARASMIEDGSNESLALAAMEYL
jgi:alkylation response protein AidB-like acyl-CoA dehydrogenase